MISNKKREGPSGLYNHQFSWSIKQEQEVYELPVAMRLPPGASVPPGGRI